MSVVILGGRVQAQSTTTTLYSYSRLALKDLDEMNKLVQAKIRESRAAKGDKIVPLREAMQAIYARPNEDFMIDKVMSPLRNELDEHGAYESTIRSLVEESIAALKKPEKVKAAAQVTYVVMLENFLGEMKPRVAETFEKSIVTLVKDADISLTRKAETERKLGMMKPTKSPSEFAAAILKSVEKKKE
jgi:hypothetical protein